MIMLGFGKKAYEKDIDGDRVIYRPLKEADSMDSKYVIDFLDGVIGDVEKEIKSYEKAVKKYSKTDEGKKIDKLISEKIHGKSASQYPKKKSYVIKTKEKEAREVLQGSMSILSGKSIDLGTYDALGGITCLVGGGGSAIGGVISGQALNNYYPLLGVPVAVGAAIGIKAYGVIKAKKLANKSYIISQIQFEE